MQIIVVHLCMCCQSSWSTVCNMSVMTSLTCITANFHACIATSLPQLINLLEDDNEVVRYASLIVLSKLSKHGM